ncbi:MAG: SDR family oxidoreductase [Alphaproteobacteria bacterium]|nr:SDR family oxidoreductase [Alphaproteobacteria bacterium]MCB9930837.1 SDR family oxidoreductase [Alphaproteobacteria bacterium]
MPKLDGKVAIITGAARGIGAAAARLFAAEGAQLMLADVLEGPLQEVANEIGDRAAICPTDVTDEASVKALVDQTVARYGKVDIALLNAGIEGKLDRIQDYDPAMFDKVIAVNVRGVWLGLKYVMQAMEQNGGSIVVTASTAGIRAVPNMSAYIASKHAAIGLMRSAAIEGSANNIRVNTVNPSPIDTPMMRSLEDMHGVPGRNDQPLAGATPLKRYGKPEEVARMMLFLASDDSSFCTGGVYMVDGGVSAGRR